MNIAILALGSSGDVHPFVGIGLALRQRGHTVRFVSNPLFGSAARSAGLDTVDLGTADELRSALDNPDVWHRRRGTWAVFRVVLPTIRPMYELVRSMAESGETDVFVASSLGFGARIAQDQFGFPMATVHLSPAQFRSSIDPPNLPGLFMPRWLPLRVKQHIWSGGDRFVLDPFLGPTINAIRAEAGLPPARGILESWWNSPDRVIGLFPDWFARPQTDWPAQSVLTGFPRYDESDTASADPELERFLDEGPPPVAFTAGTAMWHGHAFFGASLAACQRIGCRGLLLTKHADHLPANLPPTVRHVPYAPFSRLLPRCAAVVHHGGIGTTSQALAAGIPQVVVPFAHDQFDNADRVRRLGVGLTVKAHRYRATSATTVLRSVLNDPAVQSRCRQVAATLHAGDDAVSRTCEVIEAMKR